MIKKILWMGFLFSIHLSSVVANPSPILIRDPQGNIRTIYYHPIQNYAVTEGDIIISKDPRIIKNGSIVIATIGGDYWYNNIMPFEISDELSETTKNSIREAMKLWSSNTKIQFIERNHSNKEIYPDFVKFIPGPGTTCASEVGRQGSEQVLMLAPRCNTMNITHEIGHALGLWHEQSRNDRDNYIKIVWENIDPEYRHNFTQHLNDGRDLGPYNYDSLMHYPEVAFSINGEKTIIPLQENVIIGQRNHLSQGDIDSINEIYP